jgi:hypothetical protein
MMPRGGPSYNWLNTLKERAFSVVQGAGKGCTTIGQDRLVGFKGHGFNQKCVIVEAMENSPNGRHHRVMHYPNSPRKQVPLALSGVESRKLSSLPTEDTAVSEGIAQSSPRHRYPLVG